MENNCVNWRIGKVSWRGAAAYKERTMEGYEDLEESPAIIVNTPPTLATSLAPTSTPSPRSEPISKLTKQLANLTLVIRASRKPQNPAVKHNPGPRELPIEQSIALDAIVVFILVEGIALSMLRS
jgi:hypothetical protein